MKKQIVFNCGWNDPSRHIWHHYFKSFDSNIPLKPHTLQFVSQSDVTIEPYIAIHIHFYKLDSNPQLVGFWYPISSYCDYEKCTSYIKEHYPHSIYTNTNNIHLVFNIQTMGFIDCGSDYIMKHCISELQETECKKGCFVSYYSDTMRSGKYYEVKEGGCICVTPDQVNGQEYILWYISSGQGDMNQAKKGILELYPDAWHLTIDEIDSFLKFICS